MKKLLVVDGNSILNRAFYGIRLLSNRDGLYTNALYGMINIISKQIEALTPDYCAVAFDLKEPTFRHKMYDAYKAGRHAMPEELAVQFPYAKKCLEILGVTVLEKSGYEADDILGTLAREAKDHGCEAYILTGDRDSLQLIDDCCTVLLATNQDTLRFDANAFFSKYGVDPSQFVDVKALMGDSSDNIPGVAGIGEKTALKLICEFESLDNVYNSLTSEKISPSVKKKLEDSRENAFLSRTLAKICCEVPLGIDFEELSYKGIDRSAAFEMFTYLEFSAFIKRFGLSSNDVVKKEGSAEMPEQETESEKLRFDDITPEELCMLEKNKEVALSFEDGVVYVYDGEKGFCCRTDHSELSGFLCDADRRFVLYDCKSVYHQFDDIGFCTCCFDVMLAAYVLNANDGSFDLSRLIMSYLRDASGEGLPDAYHIYRLYTVLDGKIKDLGFEKLFYDIEMPLSAVLFEMEKIGFKIDREGLVSYGEKLDAVISELTERIYRYVGHEFNINSPKQLGEVLFEEMMLPHGKKTKTGYSTGAEILEKLRTRHPIIEDILDYRQLIKLKGTYIDGFVKLLSDDSRIHTTFKQTGTATGRLSSAEPNLQNIPIRTESGRNLRHYFIPENTDRVLIDADYSQIELRLLAAISGDEKMIKAFIDGEDIHTSTASAVFGVPKGSVTPEMRKRAKAVNFGIVYGIGEFSLSADLHISLIQAKNYIDSYKSNYPAVDAYLKNIVKEAYDKGYVSTLYGRRRYIPELAGQNKTLKKFGERVAMNSPIQGTAADIIKVAMINVSRRLKEAKTDARLILQVHDELVIEANKNCVEEASAILREEMENAISLTVPLSVELTVGKTWYDNK